MQYAAPIYEKVSKYYFEKIWFGLLYIVYMYILKIAANALTCGCIVMQVYMQMIVMSS